MIRINVKQNKLQIAATSLLVFMGIAVVPHVFADELVISDNGSGSNNEVHTNVSSDTSVHQDNNADVNNNVKVNENTGDNKASDNTGGSTAVNTGNASSSTSVSNNVNSSSVNITSCNCNANGSVTISGNGAYSDNKINFRSSANNNVRVNQNARINNNVDENLVTGRNDANDNVGDVSIDTGNITSKNNIFNDLLNFSDVAIAGGPLHDFLVKVFGNGAFSDNDAHANLKNDNNVLVNNTIDLINNLKHRYVTGENDANDNVGDVAVSTGDVNSETNINNVANISKVDISCNCEVTPTSVPVTSAPTSVAPTTAPTAAPTSAPAAASSSTTPTPTSAPSQVLGASAILPVTGSNLFFFMLIANVVMLLSGAYLRLRSGRSPGAGLAL